MSTETIKITDIVPARYNPRKISNEDYNKLSNSINEYGLVDPIIIHLSNNHIIGGHQRFEVLMDEYMNGNNDYHELILIRRGDIGWIFPDEELKIKDINHEKALNITLNKVQGEWDFEKLEDLFNDLTIEGLDLKLTGWGKDEIKELSKNIDLSNFGQEEIDLEESLAEEGTNTTTNSRTLKEHQCPSCGYTWIDGEEEDGV